jgi:hypothetical protein
MMNTPEWIALIFMFFVIGAMALLMLFGGDGDD